MKKNVFWLFMSVIAATTGCEERISPILEKQLSQKIKNAKLSQESKKKVTFSLSLEQEYKELLESLNNVIESILKGSASLEKFHQLFADEITKHKEAILKHYLFIEIGKDNQPHIKFLVEQVDSSLLRTTNEQGLTPLTVAIDNKAKNVARYFADYPALVNKMDGTGRTPLIKAINNELVDIVDYLLNRQADPNQADGTGISPLNAAIKKKNLALVRYLVESGAKVDERDKKGNLPLVEAINNKASNIAQYLIKFTGASLYESDEQGVTPLLAAINNRDSELVKLLFSRGASVGKKELEAVQKIGNSEITKILSPEMPRKRKSKFLFWHK